VYFLYPETTGVGLEDMDAVFGEGKWPRVSHGEYSLKEITEERQELLEQEENEAEGWFGRRASR
jgi:hypothetical protein